MTKNNVIELNEYDFPKGIVPNSDRIIIRTDEMPDITAGGIIIPDTVEKDKPLYGIIVCVGDQLDIEAGVEGVKKSKVGGAVMFGQYSGTEITVLGEKYKLMRETDVYCFLDSIECVKGKKDA